MRIVVARYNENVEWTNKFENVIIFNKGEPLGEGYNEIMMPNVGREGHTFFKYICDNYDSLDEHTVFLQGNPFDHSPHIIGSLNNLKQSINYLCYYFYFGFLSEHVIHCSLGEQKRQYWQCEHIFNTFERVFNTKLVDDGTVKYECIFGAGAQCVVSKKCILSRPKSFYENIVHILEYSIDPIEGYNIERFYKYIFMKCPFIEDV